jgi:hypothetical protein
MHVDARVTAPILTLPEAILLRTERSPEASHENLCLGE